MPRPVPELGDMRSCTISLLRSQCVELAIDEIKSILPPEQLAVDEEGWRTEHPEPCRLGRKLAIELLYRLTCFRRQQTRTVIAVLVGDGLAHLGVGDVLLLSPQSAQDGMRQRQGVEAG